MVVVVGLIILITVILPSGSQTVEEPESRREQQEFTDAGLQSQSVTSNTQTAEQIVQEFPPEDVSRKESAGHRAAESYVAKNSDLKLRLKPQEKHKEKILLFTRKRCKTLQLKHQLNQQPLRRGAFLFQIADFIFQIVKSRGAILLASPARRDRQEGRTERWC